MAHLGERGGDRERRVKGGRDGWGRRERGGKKGGRKIRERTEEQRGTCTSAQNNTCTVLMKAGGCSSGFCSYLCIVHISMTTRI